MAGNAKSLERTIIEGLIGALERAYVPARLGRINSDGTVTTKVDGRPGYVWVRLGPEGELGPAVAYNKGVPLRPHLPVRLLQIRGQWVIQEVDHTGGRLEAFLGGGGAISSVPYHTHRTKTGLEYEVEAIRLEPGRVRSVGGMIVAINPFRYQTQGGGWETWLGGNLDLTAYKPATSGHHAWVVVGIDPDTNTAVAVTGASQATSSALTTSQIDDVDVGGMIPLMAIQVANDDTALTSFSKYRDARGWLNRNFVQTLDDLQDVVVTLPQDGDKLVYSDDYGYWFNSGDSGSVGALDDLSDVNITGLLDEDILMFDSGTGQWVNVPYGSVAYLKLAGDAGGQLANGGVAAGEFLWLRGTAHATPGPIFLNDLGGGVSIGSNSNPSEDLVVENNHRLHHQVHVDRRGDAMPAQRLAHQRADGQVRHVVVVHHVEVDPVGAGGQHVVDFLAQLREVGREDRRGDDGRLHAVGSGHWRLRSAWMRS